MGGFNFGNLFFYVIMIMVKYMKIKQGDNFQIEDSYKLYRTVYEVLHPTISKKNISNYEVVLDELLLPIRVFYPKSISSINSVVVFLPASGQVSGLYGKYADISNKFAHESGRLTIAIDYFDGNIEYPKSVNKITKTILYLVDELQKNGLPLENITFVADSVACGILLDVQQRLFKKNIMIGKIILLYPVLDYDYSNYSWNEALLKMNADVLKKAQKYFKEYGGNPSSSLRKRNFSFMPRVLIITGDMDIFKDDGILLYNKLEAINKEAYYCNIEFGTHGFLGSKDEKILWETYDNIRKFLM